ncbi:MAG TPA: hypothetical protein VFN56_01275 [Candidatus Saccharimonadales bacterium]|nr:hypothetical protein [Candidatus Saccharimonadales bacterium]
MKIFSKPTLEQAHLEYRNACVRMEEATEAGVIKNFFAKRALVRSESRYDTAYSLSISLPSFLQRNIHFTASSPVSDSPLCASQALVEAADITFPLEDIEE